MNPAANATHAGGLTKPSPSRPFTAEYGLAYVAADGTERVSAMLNRTAAESLLVAHGQPGWLPRAVRVMRRDVSEWTPAPSPRPNEGVGPTVAVDVKGHTA